MLGSWCWLAGTAPRLREAARGGDPALVVARRPVTWTQHYRTIRTVRCRKSPAGCGHFSEVAASARHGTIPYRSFPPKRERHWDREVPVPQH